MPLFRSGSALLTASIANPLLLCCCSLLVGCSGLSPAITVPRVAGAIGSIQGRVFGGQQPLIGSHVYVYAVGTSGYGAASNSLLLAGLGTARDASGHYYVATDANGAFSVTGDYICTAGTQVYLYASGGDPGNGASNPAIGLLAGLGQCPVVGTLAVQVPHVVVNEVSTAAMAYALASFAVDATHISSSGTPLAQTGVANAMANVANLISISSGFPLTVTPSGTGAPPAQRMATFGNILAACVNSSGANSNQCVQLFSNAASGGQSTGTLPTDTATAQINVAHHPYTAMYSLFGLQTPAAPFQPALTAVPEDLTVQIFYHGPSGPTIFTSPDYVSPVAFAFDAGGNAWVFSETESGEQSGGAVPANVTKLSPSGVQLSSTDFTEPTGGSDNRAYRLAIAPNGDVWVGQNNGMAVFSSAGTEISPAAGYECAGLQSAISIQFGSDGTAYVADGGSAQINASGAYKFAPSGACLGALTVSVPPVEQSSYIQGANVDSQNNVYLTDAYRDSSGSVVAHLFEFPAGRTSAQGNLLARGNVLGAVDAADHLWLAGPQGPVVIANGPAPVSPATGYSNASQNFSSTANFVTTPAIDGLGNVWYPIVVFAPPGSGTGFFGNPIYGVFAEFTNSGSLMTPPQDFALFPIEESRSYLETHGGPTADGMAIDGSGNLWILSSGTFFEYVGLGAPVVTPHVAGQYGVRP